MENHARGARGQFYSFRFPKHTGVVFVFVFFFFCLVLYTLTMRVFWFLYGVEKAATQPAVAAGSKWPHPGQQQYEWSSQATQVLAGSPEQPGQSDPCQLEWRERSQHGSLHGADDWCTPHQSVGGKWLQL